MARPSNVIRRTGIYHFRRVVPPGLRARLQRSELIRSLGTTSGATAKLRSDLLYRASERLYVAASTMLPQDQLARLVQDFYKLALDIDDHRRLLGGPLSDEEHTAQAGALDELVSEHRGALGRNRFRDVDLATTIVLARQGIDPKTLGPGEHDQIRQAILRAGIDLAQDLRARYDGDFSYEPKDRLLRAPPSALLNPATGAAGSTSPAALQPAAAVPSDKEAQASPSFDGPLLSVVAPEFRRDQQATKTWDAQTVNQAGATYRLFRGLRRSTPHGLRTARCGSVSQAGVAAPIQLQQDRAVPRP